MKLKVIIGSTRPGRRGPIVGKWFADYAKKHTDFDVEIIDLKEVDLPFLDEAAHPMMAKYENEHTNSWSKTIDEADAFVFVTPEYNFGYPASIKNALDYLHHEWQHKPVAFVSYGGVSAGTRAVQALKLPITTFNMMPIRQAVNIPFFGQFINEEDVFVGNEKTNEAASGMLHELKSWAEALQGMREKMTEKA